MEKIQPAFQENNIAIAFAADDYFVPYTATMIYSILANGSRHNNYDVVILTGEITEENQKKLQKMAEPFENASIRIVNVAEYVKKYTFYTGGRENFSQAVYYRLLIPEIMGNYPKVLYLDGDMVALTDVAELYETELGDHLLASSRDLPGLVAYYDPKDTRRQYQDEVLKLKEAEDYFISGMLLFNIPAFQKTYSTKYLFKFATSRDWRYHDQDVLNVLCEGRTKLVSTTWDAVDQAFGDFLPERLQTEIRQSVENAKIAHMAGNQKPWLDVAAPFGEYFWRYAVQTPYIQEILHRMIERNRAPLPDLPRDLVEREFRQGGIGARYILKYFRAWLACKMKRNKA